MKRLLFLITTLVFLVGCSSSSDGNSTETKKANNDIKKETATATKTIENNNKTENTNVERTPTKSKKAEYLKKLETVENGLSDLKEKVDNGTQSEMNQAQEEIFKKWDAVLNDIYNELEKQLPQSNMDKLRVEQREWVKERDAKAEEASKKFEGGSLAPFEYAASLAQTTKDRCYELVNNYM